MGMSVRVVDHVGAYGMKSRAKMAGAITKAAFDIEARAKGKAAVDTGAMRAGINANGSGLDWRVDSPQSYSIFLELGTVKMGARPFLVPALEEVRPTLMAALRSL